MALPGRFPLREPWSPRGHVLLSDSDALYAVDVDHPAATPVRLTQAPVFYVSWSPDGRWLVGNQRVDPRTGMDRLLAIPLDGTGEIELAREPMEHVFWGTNGKLYYWTRGTLHHVAPPPAWRRENPEPFPIADQYTLTDRAGFTHPTMWAVRVRTYPEWEATSWLPTPGPGVTWLTITDEFVDSSRLILWALTDGPESGYKIIGDGSGHWEAKFTSTCTVQPDGRFLFSFDPSSVSADGSLIAGTDYLEDGKQIFAAKLQIADVDGRWIVQVQPPTDALGPSFSREGMLMAFEGLNDGLIHVGRLEVTWPESP